MSHYSNAEIAGLRDAECLVLALAELGLIPEVHAGDGALLNGYYDHTEKAHLIVRKVRTGLGPRFGDLGFQLQPDGSIVAIIDDYDQGEHAQRAGGHDFGAAWLGEVTRIATLHKLLTEAKRRGRRAQRIKDDAGREKIRVFA